MSAKSSGKELKALIAAVELEGVRLIESSAFATVRSPGEVGPGELSIEWNARAKKSGGNRFIVRAGIQMNLQRVASAASKPAVRVEATFELTYSLRPDFKAGAKLLAEFAAVNGVYNAWPYWREYIQDVVTRMGLPPITLPVFRVGAKVAGPSSGEPIVAERAQQPGS